MTNKTLENEAEELFKKNVEYLLGREELRKLRMTRCSANAYAELRRTALRLITSRNIEGFGEFDKLLYNLYVQANVDGSQRATNEKT